MKPRDEVVVVATGVANTASVTGALGRAGMRTKLSQDPAEIEDAPLLVLPGVGAFGAAVEHIDGLGLRQPIARRLRSRRPTLAICLGMQLLCESSEETPGVQGLGVIPARAVRFAEGARVPHMGWNRVETSNSDLLEPGAAYFANSFRLEEAPANWRFARTDYGGPFVSGLESGPVLLCQFHPELSGDYGARLIDRWIQRGQEEV